VNKLIDAVKNLPCELWLIGFGNRIKPINNVKFLGIRKEAEVINYLRSADAFVFPSDSEGMSLSLLEAMAVGLPCIVSDIPANRDTCKNTALYVERTVESIRQGICQLLESKQLQNDLSVSALELSKTRTYVNWGNHFADVIEEMVCKL
jgi:glycosyltransferase involved in cell wall biosynthesis